MSFCNICGSVGCPYCLGVRGRQPDLRTGHRHSFEDHRCPQQGGPIRSDAANCAPTERLRSDQISGGLGVNSVIHAPIIDQEHGDCPSTERPRK